MKIGELAKRANTSTRAIRHYEKMRLVQSRRLANGYREYGEDAVVAVMHIRWLISAGLTTKTIREILPCVVDKKPKAPVCDKTKTILKREFDRLQDRVREIKKSQRLLKSALGSD